MARTPALDLDALSPLQFWRALSPQQLNSFDNACEVAARIAGAVKNAEFSLPNMRGAVRALIAGDTSLLFPILSCLPHTPNGGAFAIFDLRMTIILWCLVAPRGPNRYRVEEHPLARYFLVQGLVAWADAIAPDSVAALRCARHRRSQEQREAIAWWRSARNAVLRLALEWAKDDNLLGHGSWSGTCALERLQRLLKRVGETVESTQIPEPEVETEALSGPSRIVVAQRIDVPTVGSKERQEEARYWSRLNHPLVLAGGAVDAGELRRQLSAEFPWMKPVIERICADLTLRSANGWFGFRPLLMVGPPGIGKTRFARRLAETAGVGLRVIGLGGNSDARDLMGTARGWGTATPGAVVHAMRSHEMANPLMFVDEAEKASESRANGRIIDGLLAFLEQETARAWHDECLGIAVDCSSVNWILAANSLDGLPAPLLSRVAVIRVTKPSPAAFSGILDGILADLAREHGIEVGALPELHSEAIASLEAAFRKGISVRNLRNAVESALAASMRAPRTLH